MKHLWAVLLLESEKVSWVFAWDHCNTMITQQLLFGIYFLVTSKNLLAYEATSLPWALQVAEVHSSIWVDTSLIQMTTKWWKTILTWGLQYLKMYPHFMSMPGSIKRPDGPLKRAALELQGITLPDEGTAPQHHGRVVKDRVHQQPQAWQGHESSPAWDHGVPLGAVQIRSGDRPTYSLGARSVQEAH